MSATVSISSPLPTSETGAPLPFVYADGSLMHDVARAALRIAASDATVLLTGETGTGKEVLARFVHQRSMRAKRAFVPVNCGAIPEALLESELFGHTKGAFTGAASARKGRVALAEGGTLFLDEIGELPLSLQVKLLRLLQERTYEPLGSAESVTANFRLIAATHRDLAADVEAGRFRRDLYYRLVVCPIKLPALRERSADVVQLFRHFWDKRGEQRPVEAGVLRALEAHAWPGNVRELENLVERLSVCSDGEIIRIDHLPPEFRGGAVHLNLSSAQRVPEFSPSSQSQDDRGAREQAEREALRSVLGAPAPLPPSNGRTNFPQPQPQPEPTGAFAAEVEADASALATLDAGLAVAAGLPEQTGPMLPIDLPGLLKAIEDRYIDRALAQTDGNKKAAADLLGLQRTTLVEKLRRRERAHTSPETAAK